jgi:hypothetical protein
MPRSHPAKQFWLQWSLALAIGTALRLHDLAAQLPISDEWHGLTAAGSSSYRELATLMTVGATSIPYNLYLRWLLEGIGWSEWTIRMPSLVAGIATVALAPLLLRRVIGERAALLAGGLLAVSPVLVFYSRYARPYSLVVLCVLVALVACRSWLATGSRRAAAALVAAGVFAAWLHVLELRILATCLAFAVLAKLAERRFASLAVAVSWRSLVVTSLAAACAAAALLAPAALSTGERLFQVIGENHPTVETLGAALALLAGVDHRAAALVVAPLALWGFERLVRQDVRFAALLGAVTLGCVGAIFVARPDESDVAQVFARYSIPLVPVGAIAVAMGVMAALEAAGGLVFGDTRRAHGAFQEVAAWIVVAGLLVAGPWPALHARPNAFTNHKAFHVTYDAAPSEEARYLRYLQAMRWIAWRVAIVEPAFYRELALQRDAGPVIEYPVPIGDIFLFHHLRQDLHRGRTIGGWLPPDAASQELLARGGRLPLADDVLGAVSDPSRIRFASLVRIDDPDAVRASGARHLVLHHDLTAEMRGPKWAAGTPAPQRALLEEKYGAPSYEDPWIVVWQIRGR